MFSLIILFLIIVGLVIHRYLTAFYENGMLPYQFGFLAYANVFMAIYSLSFMWIFGFWIGIVVFLLVVFQIIFSSFLWPFLLPFLINIHRSEVFPRINYLAYGSFSYLVIIVGIMTAINFFVSDYASLTKNIAEFLGGNYIVSALWVIGVMVAANIIRSYILSRYLQDNKKRYDV